MEPQSKKCMQCDKSQPITEFYRDRSIIKKTAYRSKCKTCCSKNNALRKIHNIDENIKEKLCKTCSKKRKVSEFYVSKRHTDGYFSECISCTEIKRKNKGNNKRFKRCPEYMIKYIQNRNLDPNYKLKYAMRSNLSKSVCRLHNGVKSERTMKYVGCSLEFLKNWFEYLFDNNMNWNNHGSYWHIDHIRPCSSYNLQKQEDIYSCYHWSNLRPLKKEENLIKGGIIDESLIQYFDQIKDSFLGLCSELGLLLPEVKTLPTM
jgi:hypothetical protein